jgi:predicted nucleic acid-binding protein
LRFAPDTSVVVAAFASWHEHHDIAFGALGRIEAVAAHCLLETYSVLTRLPAPHRMNADVVASYLDQTFRSTEVIALPADDQRKLVSSCAALGIAGGAVYDALIAGTCAHAGFTLLTLDTRARQAYAAMGAVHELIA